MFHLLLCKCFDKLLKQDDKGDVSNRDNGSCPGRYLGWYSYFGRASCCVTGLSLSPVTVCLTCTVGERKEYVIEEPVPDEPAANAPRTDKDKFKKHMDDMVDVGCLMLATMDSELQKQHENMVAYEMIQNLKEIYEGQARQERYETSKALFQCKMTEGTPVGAHVIKMMGYVQTLEKLGFPLKNELATDLILQSLPGSFKPFVLNFNMNEINKTLPQLLGMLRTAESDMKKDGSKSILLVREAKGKGKKVAKSKGSGKTKAKGKF
ncbi:hypothetical protein V6N13_004967 [Hibiscus sabdariffa]